MDFIPAFGQRNPRDLELLKSSRRYLPRILADALRIVRREGVKNAPKKIVLVGIRARCVAVSHDSGHEHLEINLDEECLWSASYNAFAAAVVDIIVLYKKGWSRRSIALVSFVSRTRAGWTRTGSIRVSLLRWSSARTSSLPVPFGLPCLCSCLSQ